MFANKEKVKKKVEHIQSEPSGTVYGNTCVRFNTTSIFKKRDEKNRHSCQIWVSDGLGRPDGQLPNCWTNKTKTDFKKKTLFSFLKACWSKRSETAGGGLHLVRFCLNLKGLKSFFGAKNAKTSCLFWVRRCLKLANRSRTGACRDNETSPKRQHRWNYGIEMCIVDER